MGVNAKEKSGEGLGVQFSRGMKKGLAEKVTLEQRPEGGGRGRSHEAVRAEYTAGTVGSQGRPL